MRRISRSPRGLALQAVLLATAGTTLLGPSDAEPPAAAPTQERAQQDPELETAPFPRRGNLLGKTGCKECHEDMWDSIAEGVHGPVVVEDGMQGCELCHGPGAAHGDDEDNEPMLITHPRSLPAARQTAICVQCHREQILGHGGDPDGFTAAGKGCTACHEVHAPPPERADPTLRFRHRTAATAQADAVGAARCVECHPVRDRLLQASAHRTLAAGADATGCESCHGNGARHVESGGLARLITRPDRAADGIATCRSCHADVDATEFHWAGKKSPLLSKDMRCTTCHRVHQPHSALGHTTLELTPNRPRDQPRDQGVDQDTGHPTAAGSAARPARNDLCVRCHAPAYEVLRGTIHEDLADPELPVSLGCGGCHTGAEAHAASGGQRRLVDSLRGTDARHQLNRCGKCHDREPLLRHTELGSHQRRDVTCLTCHSPAAAAGDTRRDAEKRCAQCHQEVAAQFRQPNHHPVPEGFMGCSDCHNPHSARPKIRDRQLNEQTCVGCHRQYRGPFTFAHQAGRSDGCTVCHNPHGASNRRLLHQHNTQQNCLQCHADYPAFHDQTTGAVFTNCLNCHTEIHGSNHSRFLFR